jgi:hypothetical protein
MMSQRSASMNGDSQSVGCPLVIAAAVVGVLWSVGLCRLLISLTPACEFAGVGIGEGLDDFEYGLFSLFSLVGYGITGALLIPRRRPRWPWFLGALSGEVALTWIYFVAGAVVRRASSLPGCPLVPLVPLG